MRLLNITLLSLLFALNSNATVLEREITAIRSNGTFTTSENETFSFGSKLSNESIETLHDARRGHYLITLILSDSLLTEAVDLELNVNREALQLALRAEKVAKPAVRTQIKTAKSGSK